MSNERLAKLQSMIERQPDDAFLLYAMAMEYKKLGDAEAAIRGFDRVIEADSGYYYAYYQKAQLCARAGRTELARQVYRQGIEAAMKKNDQHAQKELEAAMLLLV